MNHRPSLPTILSMTNLATGYTVEEVKSKCRLADIATVRAAYVYVAKHIYGYSQSQIARSLGHSRVSVHIALRGIRAAITYGHARSGWKDVATLKEYINRIAVCCRHYTSVS